MERYERVLIEHLLGRDEELTRLWEEHLDFERRIEQLESRPFLTQAETLERTQLKKRKLMGKDRIAAILSTHGSPLA
jgi:uncharacterized protein YdcH (DUF465 family)